MMNPFDYVNDILHDKKNLMRNSENDKLAEKKYNPWIVNLALSQRVDCVLHANLVNMYPDLDNRPQFEFLINSIGKKPKRRTAWAKKQDDSEEVLSLICETYNCNRRLALEYLSLLSNEQLDVMKEKRKKGGLDDGPNRKPGRGNATK